MTPEQLKWALEHYSSPNYDISKMMGAHRDEKTGQQTLMPYWDVSSSALEYIERIELLLAVAKETDPVRIYLRFERELDEAIRNCDMLAAKVKQQESRITRQAEIIRARENQ